MKQVITGTIAEEEKGEQHLVVALISVWSDPVSFDTL
jgi:hypothetical protein